MRGAGSVRRRGAEGFRRFRDWGRAARVRSMRASGRDPPGAIVIGRPS